MHSEFIVYKEEDTLVDPVNFGPKLTTGFQLLYNDRIMRK